MSRSGPSKPTGQSEWAGRLRLARDFKRDAEELYQLRGDDENANGVVTLIVNATIAYADALTGKYGGFINQRDHRAVTTAVERALGRRVDPGQLKRMGAILGQKDASAYGARRIPKERAGELITHLERFSEWVESVLAE